MPAKRKLETVVDNQRADGTPWVTVTNSSFDRLHNHEQMKLAATAKKCPLVRLSAKYVNNSRWLLEGHRVKDGVFVISAHASALTAAGREFEAAYNKASANGML